MNLDTMSVWQQILWYAAKLLVTGGFAFLGICAGMALRKKKNASLAQEEQKQEL